MIHPLLRLVASQPQLLADHAEAYAGLLGDEIVRSAARLKHRVLLSAIALCLGGAAAVLAGVAVLLWAALPPASIQAPWALIAVPGVPAAAAIVCALLGRSRPGDTFAELKQQIAADLVMLREVSAG